MFHYFTLEEVYQYAESCGYSREDVTIERVEDEYDWETDQVLSWVYEVSFGREYTETWTWVFDSLESVAVDYLHQTWED